MLGPLMGQTRRFIQTSGVLTHLFAYPPAPLTILKHFPPPHAATLLVIKPRHRLACRGNYSNAAALPDPRPFFYTISFLVLCAGGLVVTLR